MTNKRKILIIDDDEFLLDMYSTKFRETGFETEIAFKAPEALEKINKGFQPDIVLLDIIMPEMDGFGFLEKIKKDKILENSKIIVLTNINQKENVERAMALGASDYIVKAYLTPSEIIKKIEKLLL